MKRHRRTKAEMEAAREVKAETAPVELPVALAQGEAKYLNGIGFKFQWLQDLISKYGLTKIVYIHKFKAFRCFIENRCVDWMDVNDLSKLNGGQDLDNVLLKYQPLEKKRQLIKTSWR